MFTIECLKFGTEMSLSFMGSVYEGPHRCWKCSGLFLIRVEDGELMSCQPLSEEELEKKWERK